MAKDAEAQTKRGQQAIEAYSEEFLERLRRLKVDIHKKYVEIGTEPTPAYDGEGRKIVEQRPDGKNYIIEAYMRKKLDQYFPGWSWEEAAPLHFLGSEWVVAQGHLVIVDEHLLAFGIVPPTRRFYGVDSVRIQFKRDTPHTPENIIDIGDNCKQANTAAFKYAINRLTNIGDDIYGKRIEEEGAGSIEEIVMMSEDNSQVKAMFSRYLTDRHILVSKACAICGAKSLGEISDFKEAYQKVKLAIEGGQVK